MAGLLNDIRASFNKGDNMVRKLMFVNIGVFALVHLVLLVTYFATGSLETGEALIKWIMMPADPAKLIIRPWTWFTYMFTHQGLGHIFFNMLWLYFLGNIFKEFLGNQKLLKAYIYGGMAGGLLYFIGMNAFPVLRNAYADGASLLGASAGVMAVIVGIATLIPNYEIRLIFFDVKLKYIAAFQVFLSVIGMYQYNPGGNLAHIGGAVVGYFYIRYLRQHTWFDSVENWVQVKWEKLFSKKKSEKRMYSTYTTHMKVQNARRPDQSEVDAILDKINKSGYDSLTQTERETLFKASKD